jgi:uncharacterized protein
MNILVSGATGLVGSQLCLELVRQGHQLWVTSRKPQDTWRSIPAPHTAIHWPLLTEEFADLKKIEAVINLAGESIASGRWTQARKQRIISSRLDSVRQLWKAFEQCGAAPKVWLNASAIGFYGDRGAEELTENSACGAGFLASTCRAWEQEALFPEVAMASNTRKVALRFGMILSPKGGGLKTMLPAFQNHLGGNLGSGEQFMSWIHLDDAVQAIITILNQEHFKGSINVVAPQAVSNKTFTKTLGKVLGTFSPFPAPKFLLQIVLGDMVELLFSSQKVNPNLLVAAGFKFAHPTLEGALLNLLDFEATSSHRISAQQWLAQPIEDVFKFFSDERNLETMTPDLLQFKVLGKSQPSIGEGCLINYKLKLHGLPLGWQSRIESWQPPHEFVDTQLSGPYQVWHHTHRFESLNGGTLVSDLVRYKLPFGILGRLLQMVWVGRDVRKIFKFREDALKKIFS